MLEQPARLADDGTKLELDRLKMGIDSLAAVSLQSAEQPIALHITSLTFGQSGIGEVLVHWDLGPVALLSELVRNNPALISKCKSV